MAEVGTLQEMHATPPPLRAVTHRPLDEELLGAVWETKLGTAGIVWRGPFLPKDDPSPTGPTYSQYGLTWEMSGTGLYQQPGIYWIEHDGSVLKKGTPVYAGLAVSSLQQRIVKEREHTLHTFDLRKADLARLRLFVGTTDPNYKYTTQMQWAEEWLIHYAVYLTSRAPYNKNPVVLQNRTQISNYSPMKGSEISHDLTAVKNDPPGLANKPGLTNAPAFDGSSDVTKPFFEYDGKTSFY